MADRYSAWLGIVAFDFKADKDQRTVSGKVVRKFSLNVDGYDRPVQLDLWPDFESVDLKRGDLVMCGGKVGTYEYTTENGEARVIYQMQPYTLKVVDNVLKATPPGTKQSGTSTPDVKRKRF